jgi:hypothetical protein
MTIGAVKKWVTLSIACATHAMRTVMANGSAARGSRRLRVPTCRAMTANDASKTVIEMLKPR